MVSTSPRIVIIGAGVVGCALADQLTRRGHRAVTVLDRGSLYGAAGATAHDPGLVLQVSSSRATSRLASATLRAYAGLRENGLPLLTRSGSLEVATTPDRLDELRRRHGWAAAAGIDSRILEPGESATVHPLLDADRVVGGLHVRGDGTVDPVAVARVQARAAAARGAVLLEHRTVTRVERAGGRVTAVHCGDERHPADVVVCCAGAWSPAVGALAGVGIPLTPVVRQYATTDALGPLETIHALEAASGRADPALPVLGSAGVRVRAHGHRIGIGAAPARQRGVEPGPTSPAGLRFTPDDFDDAWDAAADLLPLLGDSKVAEGTDVVVAGTPDGRPLVGEHPDLAGFWTAAAVRTAHSAGLAEALAEWITTGRPSLGGQPIDLSGLHVGRFDPDATGTGPFRSRHVELRAVSGADGTDRRPLWFDANGALPEVCEISRREGRAARDWSPVAGAEALVVRRAAGMVDLSAEHRVEVTGPHAAEFLQRLVCSDVDGPVGHVVETLMLDADGGVLAAPTVARLGPQRFLVVLAERRDVAALRRYARTGVEITDVSTTTACLGLWGPAVGEVLRGLSPDDVVRSEPLRVVRFVVGGVPVTGLRISRIGEDGWELVCATADAERLWDTVHAAGARYGLVPVGRLAFDALRIEAGDPTRGSELSAEHGPDAVGLGALVDPGKGPFVGRAAVHALRAAGGPAETLVTLVVDRPGVVLRGQEPVYDLPESRRYSRDPVPMDPPPDLRRGPVIGRVTVAATGHSTGTSIARAWVPAERAVPGTRVEIELSGQRLTAAVAVGPPHHVSSPVPG